MRDYPQFQPNDPQLIEKLNQLTERRREDVSEYNAIVGRIGTIRKVTRIPSSSADVAVSDRLGDFNWTATDFYYLADNAGTPEWRIIASASF